VLIPEGLANLPMGKKFWPEMVGAGLFGLIAATVFFSYFRQRLRLPFPVWRAVHKPAGYLALLLVTIHVLFVSESFEQPLPRISLLSFFALTVIGTVVVKIKAWQQARNKPPRRQS
jgi:DMSO/TMAO reductase YedYZ heme-binding membrane subunit